MYLKKTSLIIFVLFSYLSFFAQHFKKIILDSKTNLPISYVYIYSSDKKITLTSNNEGEFFLIKDIKTNAFTFYKIGYGANIITLKYLLLHDTVYLSQKSVELDEITVKSSFVDAVVKDKRFYIDDYLVLPNNDFLIITSKINIKGFELSYYKRNKGVTCTKKIRTENNPELNYDCFKNYHLLTNNFSRQLLFTSDSSFDFLPKYTRTKFDSTLGISVLKLDSSLLIKREDKLQIIHSAHFSMKMVSTFLHYYIIFKKRVDFFYAINYNNDLTNMVKNELKDWENLLSMDACTEEQALNGIMHFETLVAKKIYAPIYLRNDTVIVFNFQEKEIISLNKSGIELDKIKMDEEILASNNDIKIIYDKIKQIFYCKTKSKDKTFLSVIDINSGKFSKKIKLEKTFAKNIQVQNGKIYYLVKENGWDDTVYIYQQN